MLHSTGKRELLLVEENSTWINLTDCFTPLHKGTGPLKGGFIWASERTGFRHLYLYGAKGNLISQLTGGDWLVETVAGVDETAGLVYFTGTLESPLETHLYVTKLSTGSASPPPPPRQLTQGRGRHAVVLDHQLQRFVDLHDSLVTAPRVTLCSLHDGRLLLPIFEQPEPIERVRVLNLSPPRIVQIKGADGTPLYGAIYQPDPRVHGPPPYRTVASVYGGPHVQIVSDSWMTTVDMRAQYLRSRGILVWKVSGRSDFLSSNPLLSFFSFTSLSFVSLLSERLEIARTGTF
jgi:dipeptidyl-peptidase-4